MKTDLRDCVPHWEREPATGWTRRIGVIACKACAHLGPVIEPRLPRMNTLREITPAGRRALAKMAQQMAAVRAEVFT